MALSLKKGEKLSLKKAAPSLKIAHIGLGWDARKTTGKPFDLDASAFLLAATGKVRTEKDVVYYGMDKVNGKLQTADGAVTHTGDNRTGDGDGDDEVILIDLAKVPDDIVRIVIAVTIHDDDQTFGQVNEAKVRLLDKDANVEVCHFDLGEDFSTETAVEFCALYKKDGEWKFDAIGQGYTGGLAAICDRYGVETKDD